MIAKLLAVADAAEKFDKLVDPLSAVGSQYVDREIWRTAVEELRRALADLPQRKEVNGMDGLSEESVVHYVTSDAQHQPAPAAEPLTREVVRALEIDLARETMGALRDAVRDGRGQAAKALHDLFLQLIETARPW